MILNIINSNNNMSDMGDKLLKDAIRYGGDDNIGFALIRCKGDM